MIFSVSLANDGAIVVYSYAISRTIYMVGQTQ